MINRYHLIEGTLSIVGAGDHGRVVADAARQAGWANVEFYDDNVSLDTTDSTVNVVGSLSQLFDDMATSEKHVLVAIGSNSKRLNIIEKLSKENVALVSVVHPRAVVAPDVVLGEGTMVMACAVINTGAVIGRGVIVNTGASVDHDCILGDAVHAAPASALAGRVTVGQCSFIGIGSCVVDGAVIGSDVVVGAGATVANDITDNQTVVGTPAKPISRSKR